MTRKTLNLLTLGCSKNTVDSEHIAAALAADYEFVDSQPADVCLINTCSFIKDAKEQSIEAIMDAIAIKAEGGFGSVVVFGCLGQRYAEEMPGLIPEVDAWFGARDFAPLVEYLAPGRTLDQAERLSYEQSHYAYLKISEGCDRRCSYCAIPYIRGAHKSVPVEDLVRETRALAAKGVKELIIIAQDITYYGLDLYGERALARLLREISKVDGIEWIRLHYSYPASFPVDVLDEMATNPKICKYMDIPLQHASSKLLKMMHRGVDEQQTRDLVARMREAVPGLVLRTTMIVGHPGEDEAEFERLLDFVRDARFERLGAFTYSEEEGTYGAGHYADDIPQEVKDERMDILMSLQEKISTEFNASRVGTIERVLVDEVEYEDDRAVLVARSRYESPDVDGLIFVTFDPEKANRTSDADPECLVGEFIDVRITDSDEFDLYAEMI